MAQLAAHNSRGKYANGIQVHGAMGYTWEVDLQMFMKRAWALDASWGDRGFHKARVADAILEGRNSAAQDLVAQLKGDDEFVEVEEETSAE